MAKKSTPTPTTPPPTLKVTNFGPIAEAEVELRPLTVLVGPSNTGKSYLAILLYALHRAFLPFSGFKVRGFGKSSGSVRAHIKHDIDADYQFMTELYKRISATKNLDAANQLKKEVYSLIQRRCPDIQHMIEKEMQRCFGVDESNDLISHAGKNACVKLIFPRDNKGNKLIHQFGIGKEGGSYKLEFPKVIPSEEIIKLLINFEQKVQSMIDEGDDVDPGRAFYPALDRFYATYHENLPGQTYYLPADRTGIMHSHQVVVSALVQNATTAGLRRSDGIPMLSGVLADFLDELININQTGRAKSVHADLLEKGLLRGEVKSIASNQINYPAFFYRPDGWKDDLPLMRTSSMVSELAPIVLYLRHVVEKGEMLIIEEPESHLHPEMQAQLACELARLVNNGYRIVLTTHSEWLLDQFTNLVQLSDLPEKERKKFSHADCALKPEQFGAWLFSKNEKRKGSVVKMLDIDPDVDGLTADYSDLAMNLYNEWAKIGNAITENSKK